MTGEDLSSNGTTNGLSRQCTAHKKDGERCRRAPIKGGTVCPKHGGRAPQVRAAAQQRLLMATDNLMANLLKIATSGESEAVRLRATMDALDRAGLTERHVVEVGVTDRFDALLADIIDLSVVDKTAEVRALPPGRHDDDDEDADDADEPLPFEGQGETIVVDQVPVITTLPASRPKPPAYMKRLSDEPAEGWADFS